MITLKVNDSHIKKGIEKYKADSLVIYGELDINNAYPFIAEVVIYEYLLKNYANVKLVSNNDVNNLSNFDLYFEGLRLDIKVTKYANTLWIFSRRSQPYKEFDAILWAEYNIKKNLVFIYGLISKKKFCKYMKIQRIGDKIQNKYKSFITKRKGFIVHIKHLTPLENIKI